MTWGEQNTEVEAHEQLCHASAAGINFIDTAEMYPVPTKAESQGSTDRYISTWLKDQKREDVVLATKVEPPSIPQDICYIFEFELHALSRDMHACCNTHARVWTASHD